MIKPKSGEFLGADSLLRVICFIQEVLKEPLLCAIQCLSEQRALSRTAWIPALMELEAPRNSKSFLLSHPQHVTPLQTKGLLV